MNLKSFYLFYVDVSVVRMFVFYLYSVKYTYIHLYSPKVKFTYIQFTYSVKALKVPFFAQLLPYVLW